ncbi:RNA polymerase sigma factor [Telmatocola sphagniphila]|uniref:RNA polymerase sigma factor n=1 Tax=Telmatocola sphagniphila TaxID=1123043 RepID=A0A8E6B366_9BACT|nr:RNA polymerase sigma factor [Telmatocola sphagniphila]QVL30467.1 RNA polymerase sigma factor [Telmatocola sphagniphila]
MSEQETSLVRRALSGDSSAFEELIRRTSRLIFARLYLDTGNSHLAEDLLQEVWIKAYRSLHQLRNPDGFRAWVLTIAKTVHLDCARNAGRQKRTQPEARIVSWADLSAAGPDPQLEAQREESRLAVLQALRSLPEEYRMPITLRYITGADYETIGTQLGLTNGSLRGLLNRGMKMLRDQLASGFLEKDDEVVNHERT